MPALIDYFIKLNICLTVVYLFYQLLLRRLTFYNWNRWYFMGYTVLSFIIPLINIMPSLQKQKLEGSVMLEWIPAIGFGAEKHTDFFESLTSWDWVIASLALGSLFLLFRLMVRLIAFARMKAKAQILSDDATKIYQLDDKITPFSFGNAIFINTKLHDACELEEIIRHEFVHVKQKHSIDILWCELLCILNWFNPFVWLIRHNIRQNLEFLADDKVLQNGLNKKAYQYLLLKVIGNRQFAFTNHFNFSSLKKRIAMMNSIKSARLNVMRFLFLFPVIAVLLLSFRNEMKKDITNVVAAATDPGYPLLQSEATERLLSSAPVKADITSDTIPETKKDAQNLMGIISGTDDTTGYKKPLYIVNGIKLNDNNWNIHTINPTDIERVEVLKEPEAISLYGEKGKNGVIMITTKPAQNNILQLRIPEGNEPLYIIDGAVTDKLTVDQLSSGNIESISVYKGENALSLYGREAKNGAVAIVTTKDNNTIGTASSTENGQVKMKEGNVEIIADSIFVKRKEGNIKDTLPAAGRFAGTVNYSYQNQDIQQVTVVGYKADNTSPPENTPSDVYYVLNGKHVTEKQIKKLAPNSIKSIDVLKGNNAIKFYGKKAKNGAIVIVTK